MPTARLRRVGGSTMVAIPPQILDELALTTDSVVDLTLDGGTLVITPARPRYTLDELLAQCDPKGSLSSEDDEWLGGSPVGRELI